MIDFKINVVNGKVELDNKCLLIQGESEFITSDLYKYLESKNKMQKLIPYHYTVNTVLWSGKEFEVIIQPLCFSNLPFTVKLIYKEGEHYKAINDWNKVSNIDMLSKEVDFLYQWLSGEYDLGEPDEKEKHSVMWHLEWGDITVCYDIKSFNCGIYLTWN
ncbi:hypothetical protein POW02_22320 [Enterobacter asburiae]|uniref:hypothetical protein n=1 Tax=Enterobacter asburiae TaxID=61645 RepID=UPI002FF6F61C